jgi:hypothetical protein
MADKLFWPLRYANERDVVLLLVKFTGAADVAASGYTINYGNGVATIARTAEGVITITLRDQYAIFLGLDYDISLDDYTITVDSEDVDGAKTIVLTCRTGAADTDPDSAVIGLRIWVKNAAAD